MIETDILLQNDDYIAEISSLLGGTCFRLFHKKSNREILRFPKDERELKSNVFLYGNPILFPCNRIRGGSFIFEGREYRFPINEPKTNCHIHGALYALPFAIKEQSKSFVCLRYQAKKGEYLGFPHAFAVERHYALTDEGLTEWTSFENLSKENMPLMLAFHTTFLAENTRFLANVEKEQLRGADFLPTGEYAGNGAREKEMQSGVYSIGETHLSALYRLQGDSVSLLGDGYVVEYLASKAYGYRMLYAEKDAGFMVAEPQTCAIDCFHLQTSAEKNGLLVLPPQQTLRLFTRISLRAQN